MSHGLAPEWASSTIFWRVESGKGRPETNTPPNWLIPECPAKNYFNQISKKLRESGFIYWLDGFKISNSYLYLLGHQCKDGGGDGDDG